MQRCNLTAKQMDEVLAVLTNSRRNTKDGSVRVTGLSRETVKFLVRHDYMAKSDQNRRYYPKFGTTGAYPDTFNLYWRYLPVDLVWHVVEPMLNGEGPTGYSVTSHKRWGLLNLYRRGEYGWEANGEQAQYEVLSELAAHGYVWFLAGGSVWETTKRKD